MTKQIHPLAEIYPLMASAELELLADDIKKNGLLNPIETWQGKIIDGRNRLLACEMVGVEPEYGEPAVDLKTEADLLNYITSLNAIRRHPNKGQLACIAYLALSKLDGMKGTKTRTREEYAMRFGVNSKYITHAADLHVKLPTLFKAVHLGEMEMKDAIKELTGKALNPPKKTIKGELTVEVDARNVGEDVVNYVLSVPANIGEKLAELTGTTGTLAFSYEAE